MLGRVLTQLATYVAMVIKPLCLAPGSVTMLQFEGQQMSKYRTMQFSIQ